MAKIEVPSVVLKTEYNVEKTVSEEIQSILDKYRFKYNTSQLRESIRNDIERFFYTKFGYDIANNFEIISNEDNTAISVVPFDNETLNFWKEIGLI